MECIKIISYNNWRDFANRISNNRNDFSIYRGQQNEYNYNESQTNEWHITSSFSRYFNQGEVSFRIFLDQLIQKELFNIYFSMYNYDKISSLVDASTIEKIYFFQHHGIPTCFIDFTKDPLIALYFAVAGIKSPSIKTFKTLKKGRIPTTFPERFFFTVWQINCDLLQKYFNIKILCESIPNGFMEDYSFGFSGYEEFSIALDLNPLSRLSFVDKYNLQNQQGCFLFYDNSHLGLIDGGFDTIIKDLNEVLIKSDEPIIIKHRIPYNSIRGTEKSKSILQFLKGKKISGSILFNDIQGLKFDLLNWFI